MKHTARIIALTALCLLLTAQIFGPRATYDAKLTGDGILVTGESVEPLAPVATLRIYGDKAALNLTAPFPKRTAPFEPGVLFVGVLRGAVKDKPGEAFEVEVRITRGRGKYE